MGDLPFDDTKLRQSLRDLSQDLEVDIDRIIDTMHLHLGRQQSVQSSKDEVTKICTDLIMEDPDYDKLASRWELHHLYETCAPTFSGFIEALAQDKDPITHQPSTSFDPTFRRFIRKNAKVLDEWIDHTEDERLSTFALTTLTNAYLLKDSKLQIAELPQYAYMRTAVFTSMPDLAAIKKAYFLFSTGKMTHATPTLFNSGLVCSQLASCFVLTILADSIRGIYNTHTQVALISKHAGGIGLSVTKIRARGSPIHGTGGKSNGLVPMIRVFNNTARYVDQGGGKRKGAFALYVEPWHADIREFLDLRKMGPPELRAPDLHYGLWVPDLFMRRVEEGKNWSLFCPNNCPKLLDCHGEEWEANYIAYEKQYEKIAKESPELIKHDPYHRMPARDLMDLIVTAQAETGEPFMAYKDRVNECCNQKNSGIVRSLNLCTEITLITPPSKVDPTRYEIGVCNLCSIALNRFVTEGKEGKEVDHTALFDVVRFATKSLNRVIDRTYYPLPEAKESNMAHRPIGIGVQGFADLLEILEVPFESKEAGKINREVFETLYFAALFSSNEEARRHGTYSTYEGSPMSKGILHFDNEIYKKTVLTPRWRWDLLRSNIKKHGVRNSLLVAPMPTASTAHILGNSESFNPYKSLMYVRRTLTGEYVQLRPSFVKRMKALNLWTPELRVKIMAGEGSIQHITEIPPKIREIYKTVYEIELKSLCNLALERAPFIDQSQSFNCYMKNPTKKKLRTFHMYMFKGGAKTGMYYNRTEAATDAIPITLLQKMKKIQAKERGGKHEDSMMPLKSKGKKTFQLDSTCEDECLACGS